MANARSKWASFSKSKGDHHHNNNDGNVSDIKEEDVEQDNITSVGSNERLLDDNHGGSRSDLHGRGSAHIKMVKNEVGDAMGQSIYSSKGTGV